MRKLPSLHRLLARLLTGPALAGALALGLAAPAAAQTAAPAAAAPAVAAAPEAKGPPAGFVAPAEPKPDVAAYQGTDNAFADTSWKRGDAVAWEEQLRKRSQGQNEYSRASQP